MPPKPSTRPSGFGFLAFCSVTCAVVMALLLGGSDLPSDVLFPARMAVGATGALALVTAEALWRVRPWAFSASLAFAGTFVVMLFVVSGSLAGGFVASSVAALFIAVALSIVYTGLFPNRTSVRVPRAP